MWCAEMRSSSPGDGQELFELVHLPARVHHGEGDEVQQRVDLPEAVCELALGHGLVHALEPLSQAVQRVDLPCADSWLQTADDAGGPEFPWFAVSTACMLSQARQTQLGKAAGRHEG